MIAFGFLICALPLAVLFGAWILRGAIYLANQLVGRPPEPTYTPAADDDDWSDYPIPGEHDRDRPPGVIPTPSIFGGMAMLFVITIVNVIVGAAVRITLGGEPAPRRRGGLLDDPDVVAQLLTVPVSFVITAGLLAAMLPTTFRRGALVTFILYVIGIGIAAVFAVPLFLLRL